MIKAAALFNGKLTYGEYVTQDAGKGYGVIFESEEMAKHMVGVVNEYDAVAYQRDMARDFTRLLLAALDMKPDALAEFKRTSEYRGIVAQFGQRD